MSDSATLSSERSSPKSQAECLTPHSEDTGYDDSLVSCAKGDNSRSPKPRPLDLRLLSPTSSSPLLLRKTKRGSFSRETLQHVAASNDSSPLAEFYDSQRAGRRRSTLDLGTHKGSCHCGAVAFEVRCRPRVKSLLQCTCLACFKYRDLTLYFKSDKFRVLQGKDKLTSYTYHEKRVTVKFCCVCGVKVYKMIERAPLKLANILIAIGGAHAPFEENANVESPGPSQSMDSFMKEVASTQQETATVSTQPNPDRSALSSGGSPTKTLIGVNICSVMDGNTISYHNILTCDLTSVTWTELKKLLGA